MTKPNLPFYVAGVLTALLGSSAVGATAGAPTFNREVSRILYGHCASCHRVAGMSTARPLVTYEDVRANAVAIRNQVATRAMPPWPANPDLGGPFRNDPRLSQDDIATVKSWIDAGMPRGDPADFVPLPAQSRGWQNPSGRPPDAVVTLPAFSVRPTGEIPYIVVRVKVPMARDRWVSGLQVLPGTSILVHHMGITEVQLANGVNAANLQQLDDVARSMGLPDGSFAAAVPAVRDGDDDTGYDMLATYTPGAGYENYGEGNAKLLRGGDNLYINFNIHYTTTGRQESDVSRLGFWFAERPPGHQLIRTPSAGKTLIADGNQLFSDDPGTKAEGTDVAIPPVPPNTADYSLTGITLYPKPVTLFSFQPHAHLRGRNFRYVVVYPDGRERTVLDVPRFDFHWQLTYELATPLHLPAGSKLVVTAHYDNSPGNAHLRESAARDPERRCGPEKLAYFRDQNQSWDEMFSPLVQYSVDAPDPVIAGAGKNHSVPIVAAVGCVTRDTRGGWRLNAAGEPTVVPGQSMTRAELSAAAARPLGTLHFPLIGAEFFAPDRFVGGRSLVKGALISDASGARVNVTSLSPLMGRCP